MATSSYSVPREFVDLNSLMPQFLIPSQAAQTILSGLGITMDASGYGGEWTAGERLVGVTDEDAEHIDRSGIAAAAKGKDIPVVRGGAMWVSVTGQAAGCEGKAVFMSSNNDFTFVPQAGNYLGYVHFYDSFNSRCVVVCDKPGNQSWETWTEIDDDGTFALPAQAGLVEVIGGGESIRAMITAAGVVEGSMQVRSANIVSLENAAAATTSGSATQYDLTAGDGSLAGIVDPDVPRNIVINFTDGDAGITAYTLTVTGVDVNGDAAVEVFTFADGLDPAGSVAWATVTSIVLTDLAGAGAADTIDIGYGVKFGVPVPAGATALDFDHLAVAGTEEVPAAEDATYGTFTPTTAADGAKAIIVAYSYLVNIAGSALSAIADTDGYLCLYDGGANAVLKNRLGTDDLKFTIRFTGVQI